MNKTFTFLALAGALALVALVLGMPRVVSPTPPTPPTPHIATPVAPTPPLPPTPPLLRRRRPTAR